MRLVVSAMGIFLVLSGMSMFECLPALSADGDGGAVFSSLKCGFCHKPDRKGAGPSLKEISAAYGGNSESLLRYFKGDAPSIMVSEKAGVMQSALVKIRGLSEPEMKALAGFLVQQE